MPRAPKRRGQSTTKALDRDRILQKDARFSSAGPSRKVRAEATKQLLARVWRRWERYSALMHGDDANHEKTLLDAGLEDFRRYFHHRLIESAVTKQSSLLTEWKCLLILYRDLKKQPLEIPLREEMHGLLHGQFVDEYDLDMTTEKKSVMNVEDLLFLLHYLWAFDTFAFPIERQRVQLSLLLLIIAYTTSRPGALVEAHCAHGTNECLVYKDVRLLVIPNPEEPDRNVIVMEVSLRYTKGRRDTNRPTIFLFHEREDNLTMCPILHMLALALADEAFEAGIRSVEDIYRLRVTGGRNSLELRWKESMLDVPVFRRLVSSKEGITTSSTRALTYNVFNKSLRDLGQRAGLRWPLTPYCLRRAAGNALDGQATEAERNQAMGHSRSDIFLKYYIQQQVKADVQSAYLGTPARHALFHAVSRMCLDRDARVPQDLDDTQKAEVRQTFELRSLLNTRTTLKQDIIQEFGKIKNAVGTPKHEEHRRLLKRYCSMEKTLLKDRLREVQEAFFQSIDTKEIETQLGPGLDHEPSNDGELFTPAMPIHQFHERSCLAVNLFGHLKSGEIEATRTRRFAATKDMSALTFKRGAICQSTNVPLRSAEASLDVAKLSAIEDEPDLYPLSCPATLCLFCLGNDSMTDIGRTYSYARKDSLTRHVEMRHLRYMDPSAEFQCPHPGCQASCYGHLGFKRHAAEAHNIIHAARSATSWEDCTASVEGKYGMELFG
ncbi:MAG: hypothetical protein Q9162_007245 [Coniocarpon cinnabarinum]